MNVLVTGSAGRIAACLIDELLARGNRVRGLDRCQTNRSSSQYEEIIGSLEDEETVQQAVRGVDAVVHLAALMSWSPLDQADMFRINVEGTRILLEACTQAGVNKFLFASSGEVYPENSPQQLPIDETHPLHANSTYGLTKILGEELVRFYQRTGRLDTVILRFSHTQDARELLDETSFFSGPRFFLQPRIAQQETLGNQVNADLLRRANPGHPAHVLARNEDGRPYQMHITDTRDMTQGLLLALDSEKAAGDVFNLGATEPVDFEQLLIKMSATTGYSVITVDLPGKGVFYHTDNQKIRKLLGYEPQWHIDKMLAEAAVHWKGRTQND